jgi:hypothetical protein
LGAKFETAADLPDCDAGINARAERQISARDWNEYRWNGKKIPNYLITQTPTPPARSLACEHSSTVG